MNQHVPVPQAPDEGPATPVMQQYLDIKAANPGSLLFYRMGDFYELLFEDAERAAAFLNITLTRRGKHRGVDVPMCGVPVVRSDEYLHRLIRGGHRVAVCEQMESPAEARLRGSKTPVRREVVRLVTPGTVTEDALLEPGRSCTLAAIARVGGGAGASYALAGADITTGRLSVVPAGAGEIESLLAMMDPREILVPDDLRADPALAAPLRETRAAVTPLPRDGLDPASAGRRLAAHYGVASLDAFGDFGPAEVAALGTALAYLLRTQVSAVPRLAPPVRETHESTLRIDPATRASLELVRTLSGERPGSLLGALDRTVTPAGARLLCERVSAPSRDLAEIAARHDAVGWLAGEPALRDRIRRALREVPDLMRGLSRLALGRGGPRDLACVRSGIEAARVVGELARGAATGEVAARLADLLAAPAGLAGSIRDLLVDEPPHACRDGGFVREGADPDLDEARRLSVDSRQVVAGLQASYAERAGCRTLRIKHTGQLGYFVEVPLAAGEALRREPDGFFIPRQTMTDAMRFTTVELGDLESRIASAGTRAQAIEEALFDRCRAEVLLGAGAIEAAAAALAVCDVAAGLAEAAADCGWTRPEMTDGHDFEIAGGRHPVVEASIRAGGGRFVPNGCALGGDGSGRILVVTGPNMGGKSTYLRQNALMAVMAQAGSFLPADRARIGVVDRLFSRVGAADDLARGRSTFMVEMVETAAILNQATDRSLVVLDEIGRGTATHDGLSIAWACVERLHAVNRCRSLFATHYHELSRLGDELERAENATLKVAEHEGDAVFLHEVVPGAADRSYGLHVARLAGIPADVVARAEAVMAGLESAAPSSSARKGRRSARPPAELPLFAALAPAPAAAPPDLLRQALSGLDPDAMSPREALEALYRLRGLA
jgi:DNA mismatch repair protein MutS